MNHYGNHGPNRFAGVFPSVSRGTSLAWSALLIAAALLGGCATMSDSTKSAPAQTKPAPAQAKSAATSPPANSKPREEIVRDFEKKRDQMQFEAALARWKEHDPQGCREAINRLLARDPQHHDALLLLADVNLVDQRPQDSLPAIEKLARQYPDNAEVHHALGMLLEASNRPADALGYYRRAVELQPKNKLYALSLQSGPPAMSAGSQPPSKTVANSTAQMRPVSANVTNAVRGDAKPAAPEGKTVALDAVDPQMRFAPVQPEVSGSDRLRPRTSDSAVHAASNQEDDSRSRANPPAQTAGPIAERSAPSTPLASPPESPKLPDLQTTLRTGAEALRAGQTDRALEILLPVAEQNPNSAAVHRLLGAVYYRRADYSAARQSLQTALSLDKDHALSYFLLGHTLSKLGQADEAEQMLFEAARLDSRFRDRPAGTP